VDPTEFGAGSATFELSEAVKSSGAYDAWAPPEEVQEIPDGMETVQPKKVKVRDGFISEDIVLIRRRSPSMAIPVIKSRFLQSLSPTKGRRTTRLPMRTRSFY
jgi:hypothetical protein